MSDLQPFKHAEEGTHSVCFTRLENEGNKALCCDCVPHEDCQFAEECDCIYGDGAFEKYEDKTSKGKY